MAAATASTVKLLFPGFCAGIVGVNADDIRILFL